MNTVLDEYLAHLPPGSLPRIHVTSVVEQQAEQAVRPLSLALGVFGVLVAIAAILIGAQAVARLVRRSTADREVLHALGADPLDTAADGLLGIVGAIVLGTLLAVGVAVGLSPLAPLGPVRDVLPTPGLALDWTVIGLGTVVLVSFLMASAVAFSYLDSPHRRARRGPVAVRTSAVADAAASAGFPTAAVAGIRFALEPGQGRTAPRRSTTCTSRQEAPCW